MAYQRIPAKVGDVFGRLTIIAPAPHDRNHRMWLCRCECGVVKTLRHCGLTRGDNKSCGCARTPRRTKRLDDLRMYRLWHSLLNRCRRPEVPSYAMYGGRGITVCDRWLTFDTFLADVSPRPSLKHTLDRIDNARGYEPGNVRWATRAEQSRNTSRNRWFTHNGETMIVTDWAARMGLKKSTVTSRISRCGWTVERALLTPVQGVHHQAS